jgi:hypothetical protein
LSHLSSTSSKGFAVNFVHLPNPGERAKAGLYCANPMQWIDFCEKSLGSEVYLIDDYGMSEFTLLIRPIQVSSGNYHRLWSLEET